MLSYLSKFVLQMLPTISATVIGAYIVATWINPKTPADAARIAARSQAHEAAKALPAEDRPAQDEAAPAEVKSLDAAEDAGPVKAASAPDNIRIIPIVKQPAPAINASVSVPAAETAPAQAVDQRRDANELARAAIQRLRGGSETVRTAEEPAKPVAPAVRVQHARVAPEASQALPAAPTASAPPLPPAVSIPAPRYPQSEAADQASPTEPDRPTPPGEIPLARPPVNLQASQRMAENPSLADDFLSATKSFFRAITPQ